MKLATLRDRSRDGRLVVVSRDLTLCSDARHLAPTLQAALDDWDAIFPELERISRGLATGGQPSFRFHEREALAPLPRAYQRADADGRHGTRLFAPPRAPADPGPSVVALAALTGDLPRDAGPAAARAALRLFVLLRLSGGATALAPAAVTPDELDLDDLAIEADGAPVAALSRAPDLGLVVARAARDRPLAAGCLVADEPVLESSFTPRIEIRDAAGRSVFGAIEGAAAGP